MTVDRRALIAIVLIIGTVGFSNSLSAFESKEKSSYLYGSDLLNKKNRLEDEARVFEKNGKLDEAIAKYDEAVALDKKIYGSDMGRPLAAKAEVYQKQGRYQEALEILKKLREFHPQHKYYIDWEQQLEALVKSRTINSQQPVLSYIRKYKLKYKMDLPPNHYTVSSVGHISAILYLYDVVGDYDAGIKFIDDCILYFEQKDIKKYGEYRPGKNDREYQKVREAFEKDKAEGSKGRATQVLIQSDYFPW